MVLHLFPHKNNYSDKIFSAILCLSAEILSSQRINLFFSLPMVNFPLEKDNIGFQMQLTWLQPTFRNHTTTKRKFVLKFSIEFFLEHFGQCLENRVIQTEMIICRKKSEMFSIEFHPKLPETPSISIFLPFSLYSLLLFSNKLHIYIWMQCIV